MSSRRYRKSGSIIIPIIFFSVIAVIVAIALIYSNGVRYIKNKNGEKFFGFVDKNNIISEGRIWGGDGSVINVFKEKYYSVVYRPDSEKSDGDLTNILYGEQIGEDVLEDINSRVNSADKTGNALGEIVLNDTDSEYYLLKESLSEFITSEQSKENYISEGWIVDNDGIEWNLVSSKSKVSSYGDFDVVKSSDSSVIYKGGLFAFLKKEDIKNGYILLRDAVQIMLYKSTGLHRMVINMPNDKKDIYIGQINSEFEKNGTGILYFDMGDVYYGDFIENEREGKCCFRTSFGDLYKGDIKGGKKSGQGIYIWSDGTTYDGGFSDNMKNGKGKYIFANGESYDGDYFNDVKQGKGTYIWANGDTYTGDFVADIRTGEGVYTWAESGEMYEGSFKDNELNGTGTYYWSSGRTYTGLFANGKMVIPASE